MTHRTGCWGPTRRDIVLPPALPQSLQRILDVLHDAGREGLTQWQIREMLGLGYVSLSATLQRLVHRGLIYAEEEEGGATGARLVKRWRLARYRPRPQRNLGTSIAAPRTGTLADPWGVAGAPRVIDSRQCRAWAAAAAGGFHG